MRLGFLCVLLLPGCGRKDPAPTLEPKSPPKVESKTFTRALPTFTLHEETCDGRRFSVGVPEGWQGKAQRAPDDVASILACAVNDEKPQSLAKVDGVLVTVGDPTNRAGLAVLVAPDQDRVRKIGGASNSFERLQFQGRYARSRGWTEDPRTTPRTLWVNGERLTVNWVDVSSKQKGFVAVLEQGLRYLVVGLAVNEAYEAMEPYLLAAMQGIQTLDAPDVRGAIYRKGTGGLDGVYRIGDRYYAFHVAGLVANLTPAWDSRPPLPYDRFAWLRYAAFHGDSVGRYSVTGGKVKIEYPGDTAELEVSTLLRADVDLDVDALVGTWKYEYVSSGRSDVLAHRSLILSLRKDGTFEDAREEFARLTGSTHNPNFNPMEDSPDTRIVGYDAIRKRNGKGQGTWKAGRGYLELQYSDGVETRVPCWLEGGKLWIDGDACSRS